MNIYKLTSNGLWVSTIRIDQNRFTDFPGKAQLLITVINSKDKVKTSCFSNPIGFTLIQNKPQLPVEQDILLMHCLQDFFGSDKLQIEKA